MTLESIGVGEKVKLINSYLQKYDPKYIPHEITIISKNLENNSVLGKDIEGKCGYYWLSKRPLIWEFVVNNDSRKVWFFDTFEVVQFGVLK